MTFNPLPYVAKLYTLLAVICVLLVAVPFLLLLAALMELLSLPATWRARRRARRVGVPREPPGDPHPLLSPTSATHFGADAPLFGWPPHDPRKTRLFPHRYSGVSEEKAGMQTDRRPDGTR